MWERYRQSRQAVLGAFSLGNTWKYPDYFGYIFLTLLMLRLFSVQCTRLQKITKVIVTMSSGYSYESSHWVLSDEYPFARVLTHLHSEQPKEAWLFWEYFPYKSIFLETSEWELSIRRQTINLLQIFCEISLHSQVIFKSMKVADTISRGTLECEWVNHFPAYSPHHFMLTKLATSSKRVNQSIFCKMFEGALLMRTNRPRRHLIVVKDIFRLEWINRHMVLYKKCNFSITVNLEISVCVTLCVISALFASPTIHTYFQAPKIHKFSSVFWNGDNRKNKRT